MNNIEDTRSKLLLFILLILLIFNIIAGDYWLDPDVGLNLIIYCILKFILIILAISCPIPAGVFIPTFTMGAAIGRTFGYFMKSFGVFIGLPNLIACNCYYQLLLILILLFIEEAIYAIIGASATAGILYISELLS